jgi:hypothetical protein
MVTLRFKFSIVITQMSNRDIPDGTSELPGFCGSRTTQKIRFSAKFYGHDDAVLWMPTRLIKTGSMQLNTSPRAARSLCMSR